MSVPSGAAADRPSTTPRGSANARRVILGASVVAVLAFTPVAASEAVQTARPATTVSAAACSTAWGSGAESRTGTADARIVNVRTGRHTCFDRLVVDLDGPAVGYRVRYVTQVRQDGSGTPVPLRGAADLEIVVIAPAYDDTGTPTYHPARPSEVTSVAGYRTFRQVAWAGSFEGQTTLGLGVRARLPFRVQTVTSGGDAKIIIDVAHVW